MISRRMASYSLQVKASVAKDLRSIPKKDVNRILKRIERLTADPRPRGAEKLTDRDHYRIRVGIYRVLYEIKDDLLIILGIKIAKRDQAYR